MTRIWRHASAPLSYAALTIAMVLPFLSPIRASAQEEAVSTDVRAADLAAGTFSVSNFRYHILQANTQAGRMAVATNGFGTPIASAPRATAATIPAVPAPGFYPSDLKYFGGAVLTSTVSHDVYVNCTDVSVAGATLPGSCSIWVKAALFTWSTST